MEEKNCCGEKNEREEGRECGEEKELQKDK
jgi:hypothetical protein